MKRILAALVCLVLLCGCGPAIPEEPDGRLQVVASVFPAYDFAREAGGEFANVSLLLPPGAESHSYEPTPADILRVQQAGIFREPGRNLPFQLLYGPGSLIRLSRRLAVLSHIVLRQIFPIYLPVRRQAAILGKSVGG